MNYIQQAFKGKNEWYNWVLTIIAVFIGWQIIGVIPILTAAFIKTSSLAEFSKAIETSFRNIGLSNNLYLFLIISMFFFGLISLFFSIKYIHRRSVNSVITSRATPDFKRFCYGFFVWGLIATLTITASIYAHPEDYEWNFRPIPFFTLLLISFLFLPIQTSFEEILFRGYFMQGIGILAKNRWVPLLFTSVAFGLLHYANPEVAKLGSITMLFYIGTGLFYGIITLMDEGLELALGLHAVNNIIVALFVTANWTAFKTDALFIDTAEPSMGWETFFSVLILYPFMLYVFAKKYNWKNWIKKLTGKIEKPLNL